MRVAWLNLYLSYFRSHCLWFCSKLIGAKYFKLDGKPDPDDILSPVDVEGHGTHTASTVAGNIVKNANLFGLAKGTARGAVPSARVAMYKVCWVSTGCSDMDLLAGFEAAIADGVDVISISIGGFTFNYAEDIIAIGAFHAMKKGILTIASAGNDGPDESTIVNHAPWILTVGASGIDRSFRSKVVLGNGKTFLVTTFSTDSKSDMIISSIVSFPNSFVCKCWVGFWTERIRSKTEELPSSKWCRYTQDQGGQRELKVLNLVMQL